MYITLTSLIPLPYNITLSISTLLQELTSRARPYYDRNIRPHYDKHVRARYDEYALSNYGKVAEPELELPQSNMATGNPAITFAIRSTQALFAIIVFGLACSLIKGHEQGSLPSTLSFAAFIGGVSFIGALLGVAGHWMQVLQGQVGLFIDTAIAGVNLAGGIVSPDLPRAARRVRRSRN